MTEATELVELSADAAGCPVRIGWHSSADRSRPFPREAIRRFRDRVFPGPVFSCGRCSCGWCFRDKCSGLREALPTGTGLVVDRAHKAGVLPVPEGIAALLPQGGLVRGTVVFRRGCSVLAFGIGRVGDGVREGTLQSSGSLDWDCWRRTRWVRNWNVWHSFRRLGRIRSRLPPCCSTVWIW